MFKDKRFIIILLVLAGIALHFWTSSRVPALNEKALMGGDMELGALGFDVVIPVRESDPVLLRAIYESINWVKTNQRGMTFGVLFAATLMLLLSLIKKRSFKNSFANSLLGMVIGAPLGVCVNCAAPIAKGLYTGGARIETTVAAMISSPTLNVIVLTILISLFPIYMVTIKLALTVGFILLMVPILTKYLAKNVEYSPSESESCPINFNAHAVEEGNENWISAIKWTALNWLKSFWHVFKTTVPLMFLAGFLGSLLVTLLPWDSVAELLPHASGWKMVGYLAAISLVGVFLPVPIAFDVILVAILLAAGLPIGYAMALLFTLGIFSVYSFFIVWREISKPMAVGISVVIFCMGIGAGIIGHKYQVFEAKNKRQTYYAMFSENADTKGPTFLSVGEEPSQAINISESSARIPSIPEESVIDGLNIKSTKFRPRTGDGNELFTKYFGKDFGLDEPYSFSVMDYILSWGRFRGVASADINNDGFPDLLFTSKNGLSLYYNDGGERFISQPLKVLQKDEVHTVNAAFVDIDNDEWLDIVVATHHSGNYWLRNIDGHFQSSPPVLLPNRPGAFLTGAMGFGDVDHDGDLDAVFGNFGYGTTGLVKKQDDQVMLLPESLNALLINHEDSFEVREYSHIAGDTMSTLLSDFNNDGHLDLISTNDFTPPDVYLIGDGKGGFLPINREDNIVPFSGKSTMSVVTADVNNDLIPEIFVVQISGRAGRVQLDLRKVGPEVCAELEGSEYFKPCLRVMDVQSDFLKARKTQDMDVCLQTDDEFREDCVALLLLLSATKLEANPELCNLYSESWNPMARACKAILGRRIKLTSSDMKAAIPQQGGGNALLFLQPNGSFEDRAKEYGLKAGGWSWNARFADIDNDEWQDVLIVNGDFITSTREANFLYKNHRGESFTDVTAESNFDSHLATSSYTYLDMDHDGDLDIISVPEVGPIFVHRNNLSNGNSIAIELRDYQGNVYGVGSKIFIRYGKDGKRNQMREIQLSGGFVSYDAPIAYFGLGDYDSIGEIEIQWSTGEHSKIPGPFSAGAKYTITRNTHTSDGKNIAADFNLQ